MREAVYLGAWIQPPTLSEEQLMDWKIELIFVPVTDVDRAKAFYVDRLGFSADFDQVVNENLRFVQATPPGSACSIAFGTGISDMEPGSQRGIQVVVPDADAARQYLLDNDVEATEVDEQPWGRFVFFSDPDGNAWTLQQLPPRE
jgi:catechol 2,3-dioxygenase-like lactoylglutathione lyase family enzyme